MSQDTKTAVGRVPPLERTIFHLLPILVICALWLPVPLAYYVPEINISDEMVQHASASPPDSVLDELKDFAYLEDRPMSKQELVDVAAGLLRGDLQFQDCSAHISVPFSPRDLKQVPPACELTLAGFQVPDELLRAYEASGREEFLAGAQTFISAAEEYDRAAWLPQGEFWNDHALAARVSVLANFWRLYRHSPKYQPEVARQVLQMVSRSQQLLAKPALFTSGTNHGIMQNLALWHASLAFPSLPHTQDYQRLAMDRLSQQMKFYVSEEGVVLEHSAGYQLFGLKLLGWAFRYLDLMNQTAPKEWIGKYERAKNVYATLRRPDGSLPTFGDTYAEADPLGPPVTTFDPDRRAQRLVYQPEWKPVQAESLYPVSGYSVWWDGLEFWPKPPNLSQTVVAWSNFSGHAHKHADEMSVLFWAGGQTWLSNIGYWPYENEWRDTIVSWPGSNAPHLVGENSLAPRTTKLLSSGSSDDLKVLELERSGAENYVARRQVIHWKTNLWLVLDSTSGPEKSQTTTTWTSPSDVRWQRGPAGAFHLKSPNNSDRLDLFFLGSANTVQRLLRGSSHPFAGWQVERGVPVPASALVVEQPARNSWAATIWSWEKAGATAWFDGQPQMTHWQDATNWELQLPTRAGGIALRRQGDMLRLHPERGTDEDLELAAPPDVTPQLEELRMQFDATASRYRHFSENTAKRTKVTYLLIAVFLMQQIFFFVYKRLRLPHLRILKILNMVAWIGGGIWLIGFYF